MRGLHTVVAVGALSLGLLSPYGVDKLAPADISFLQDPLPACAGCTQSTDDPHTEAPSPSNDCFDSATITATLTTTSGSCNANTCVGSDCSVTGSVLFATSSEDDCGQICMVLPNSTRNYAACPYTWDAQTGKCCKTVNIVEGYSYSWSAIPLVCGFSFGAQCWFYDSNNVFVGGITYSASCSPCQ